MEIAQTPLTPDEVKRYARHIALPGIGEVGQSKLKSARVLCVGAGGLGSPILMYLAAAGVGTLGIVDFDIVNESNLQRQIIHRETSIGMKKTESAASTIAQINPNVAIELHSVKLSTANIMQIFENYDVIVDGTDNFATRYLINDAATLLHKPCVWGSIFQFDGQAGISWAAHGPCYRCLYPQPPEPGSVLSCSVAGVFGVLCASIASIQSTETVKLITGVGVLMLGSIMTYDALEMEYRKVTTKKDPHCSLCGPQATQFNLLENYEEFCGEVSTITATQLKSMIDTKEKFFLVDVREPHEWEIVRIPGATLIPLAFFLDGSALPKMPRDMPIIMHCRSGMRSATSLEVLKSNGFTDVKHLQGGVLAWVKEIDPSLTLY